jgi:hypothetical protein
LPGGIAQYSLPLSAASAPNFTIAASGANGLSDVCVDASGNLATLSLPLVPGGPASTINTYSAPLSAGSAVSASFSAPTTFSGTGQIAFASGALWAATGAGTAAAYAQPLSSSTLPATTVTLPASAANGIALDSTGNLYVAVDLHAGSEIDVYAPPYTGLPIVSPTFGTAEGSGEFRRLAVGGSQLFVGTSADVEVYSLPITAGSTPAFAIPAAGGSAGLALDANGNLYAAQAGAILVYAPPFSASSRPALSFSITGSSYVTGIAIGE